MACSTSLYIIILFSASCTLWPVSHCRQILYRGQFLFLALLDIPYSRNLLREEIFANYTICSQKKHSRFFNNCTHNRRGTWKVYGPKIYASSNFSFVDSFEICRHGWQNYKTRNKSSLTVVVLKMTPVPTGHG